MDDLIAFITARLDEDEAAAKAAHYEGQHWLAEEEGVYRWPDDELVYMADRKRDAAHIVRHQPARVLRDVAAKRAILALHPFEIVKREVTPFNPYTGEAQPDEYEATCEICGWFDPERGGCQTNRTLAAIWSDHPGYRDGWKP